MRNKYIKFCDIHGINDGLLREYLISSLKKAAVDQIHDAIRTREKDIMVLKELGHIISGVLEGEFCENCGHFIPDYKRMIIYCINTQNGINQPPCPGHKVGSVICSQKCYNRFSLG